MTETTATPTVEQLIAQLDGLNQQIEPIEEAVAKWGTEIRILKDRREAIKAQIVEQLGKGSRRTLWDDEGAELATVTIPKPSRYLTVADLEAYSTWVAEHHPDQVEVVTQVRPAFTKLVTGGEGVTPDGEVVPGLVEAERRVSPRVTFTDHGREVLRGAL